MMKYSLKPGSVIIHVRDNEEIITEIIPKSWPSNSCWFTEDEIVERGEIFKIHHSYSPLRYFEYVRPEDLRSIG